MGDGGRPLGEQEEYKGMVGDLAAMMMAVMEKAREIAPDDTPDCELMTMMFAFSGMLEAWRVDVRHAYLGVDPIVCLTDKTRKKAIENDMVPDARSSAAEILRRHLGAMEMSHNIGGRIYHDLREGTFEDMPKPQVSFPEAELEFVNESDDTLASKYSNVTRRRLLAGRAAMRVEPDGQTEEEIRFQMTRIADGIRALQSLDDLGPEMNKHAGDQERTLQERYSLLERRLAEVTDNVGEDEP